MEKTNTGTTRHYIYGPAGVIAFLDSNTTYYVFKDHLGSTRAVMNGSTGSGVEYFAYDAWGKVMQSIVAPQLLYRYTGQEYDGETGLDNYRARMYDQGLGRFYAIDPAEEGFGMYNYAQNNPLIFIDPTGMYIRTFEEMRQEQQRQESLYNRYRGGL